MALDGLLLHNIMSKLDTLCPCKIGKIQNISEEEILFHLHTYEKGNQKLVINVHSNTNRIYLSNLKINLQQTPSNFVMVLRKQLSQGIIESIEQIGYDRILCFYITTRNEFQDLVKYKLYVELMGKYANMVLVNQENLIVDALKRIPVYENSKRLIHPGAAYTLPDPGNKMDPLHPEHINMDESFVKQIYGFSPVLSNEFHNRILHRESYDEIMQQVLSSNSLYVYKKEFHCIPLLYLKEEETVYDLMEGLNHLYSSNEQKNRLKEQCGDVFRTVDKELNRNVKKLPKLKLSLEQSKDYQKYQEYGDLLFAYMYECKKEPVLTLPSFSSDETVRIPIDMRFDLKTNANKYYQKYHKLKRSQSILEEQIEHCQNEIDYYTQLQEQLMHCQLQDALEIKEELISQKIMHPKKEARKKKSKKPNILHLAYKKADIFIGKNNIQNNYITHQIARKTDMWFHVKDYHGSHVVCKCEHLDEDLIRMCAQLASFFSKGKQSSSVPVDYCTVSQLKKVPGSKIGFVTMKSYKTIYIDPDPVQIEKWIKEYQTQ